ncbi:pantoate--beta-alanine ligase [Vibrio sp. UCD-FRSSP16_10]|uniref:pantoate--beta-alanine ligase n=1 Tax=unclassified Vibrio TaxID=2614977 RepID=UPI000800CB78|nr:MULTISPECIES: pantoate--beta-alanine ligase [unclassified Vibrio]OBT17288.1 pantoate--beta-alanine ligase [Vibrio sp. UCD-FRSSP16_30]OBT23057.1 pantoate--beta-alanine ligase [Vibrio sp. UCD-FRSSP16_10]
MLTIEKTTELRAQIRAYKKAGKTIGFVPTMGNLHQGHLTLVRKAKELADIVVVSIFVNPLQFGNHDDLHNYPRTLEQDLSLLSELGTELVFTPTPEIIYPNGLAQHTFVEVPHLSSMLEGASRPGHFRGVATVVTKLFNLVQPDVACFGEKDFQQVAVIRQMVEDLAMDINIVPVSIVREQSGLALSSRNNRLTEQERAIAPNLAKVMSKMADNLLKTPLDSDAVIRQGEEAIIEAGMKPDELFICDAYSLGNVTSETKEAVILMAAFLGQVRLIDNIIVKIA